MSRPVDWSPLRSSDPTPGDPEAVAALARRYRDTAQAIADAATRLKGLVDSSSGAWVGKSGDTFRKHAGDLSDRITKAQSRYQQAGDALATFASKMEPAQQDADAALAQAKQAQQQLDATQPGPPPAPGAPPPTAAEQAAESKRSADHAAASQSLGSAESKLQGAETDYHTAASTAAHTIHDAIQHDGVHDSWWDRNFHWVKTALKWIGAAVVVLTIVALVIALVVPGLDIAAAGALLAIGEVMGNLAAAGTVALLAGDSALALTHKGSWANVAIDALALVSFGFGRAAAAMGKAGVRIGGGIAAGRAGRAAVREAGMPGVLYSLTSRSAALGSLARTSPRVAEALGNADRAAAAARGEVTSIKATPSLAMRAAAGGDLKIADASSKLGKVQAMVPGSVRVTALNGLVRAGGAGAGAVNYTALGWGANNANTDFIVEPANERAMETNLAGIVDRYSSPLVTVP